MIFFSEKSFRRAVFTYVAVLRKNPIPVRTGNYQGNGYCLDPTSAKLTIRHPQVKAGACWWYRRYAPKSETLNRLEAEAREAKRGLWAALVHESASPPR